MSDILYTMLTTIGFFGGFVLFCLTMCFGVALAFLPSNRSPISLLLQAAVMFWIAAGSALLAVWLFIRILLTLNYE